MRNRGGGNVADAQSWWSRVSIVAGSMTLSLAKVWEKSVSVIVPVTTARSHLFFRLCRKSNGTKNVGNHAQEAIKILGRADTPEEPSQPVDWLSPIRKAGDPQLW